MPSFTRELATRPKSGAGTFSRASAALQLPQVNFEKTGPGSANSTSSPEYDFSRIPIFARAGLRTQPAPTVSQPGDSWEQQADQMALQVMRKSVPRQPPRLRAKPAAEGNSGHPMDPSTRHFMETRFGVDFSQVRLHTDSATAESAKALHARAFTVGNDIGFAHGQYSPGSQAARSLLAHELAHVVQQGSAPGAGMPAILRYADGPEQATASAGLRRQYIELACEVIADIQRGIEEGRTWDFEDEFLLQGDEELADPASSLVVDRRNALQNLVINLDELIRELEAGTLTPTQPASRTGLRALWSARYLRSREYQPGRAPRGHPIHWSHPNRTVVEPSGRLRSIYNSLGGYIDNQPSSPPGMLQAGSLPTWWVLGCHSPRSSELPQPVEQSRPAERERVTPNTLGLLRDRVIFIYRTRGEITNWDWEPRSETYIEASRPFGPHEWHYDESAGRVYVIVDSRQYNLLRNGRVERQP
jgi:hypothetical protein